ncbi:unnamed protein product [Paramecium sonneborni]|uniref:Uncharacterized protein n=1 Tax=Paramecium sonneborni TaxID=65129 RepID=A0A8S1QCB9_9CILI|nr:unnamed protein product [Paramecium sonneborni]
MLSYFLKIAKLKFQIQIVSQHRYKNFFHLISNTQLKTQKSELMISIVQLKIIRIKLNQEKQDGIPIFQIQIIKLQLVICGGMYKQLNNYFCRANKLDLIFQLTIKSKDIYVKSISGFNSLFFQEIEMIYNIGSDFSNVIITFEIEQFKIFKIINSICYQNSEKQKAASIFQSKI